MHLHILLIFMFNIRMWKGAQKKRNTNEKWQSGGRRSVYLVAGKGPDVEWLPHDDQDVGVQLSHSQVGNITLQRVARGAQELL